MVTSQHWLSICLVLFLRCPIQGQDNREGPAAESSPQSTWLQKMPGFSFASRSAVYRDLLIGTASIFSFLSFYFFLWTKGQLPLSSAYEHSKRESCTPFKRKEVTEETKWGTFRSCILSLKAEGTGGGNYILRQKYLMSFYWYL